MNNVTREQIAERMQQKFGLSKAMSREILAEIIDQITDTVANGGRVTFVGFGTFEPFCAKERIGRNVSTGEDMVIPAAVRPKFRPGAEFTNKVKDNLKVKQS